MNDDEARLLKAVGVDLTPDDALVETVLAAGREAVAQLYANAYTPEELADRLELDVDRIHTLIEGGHLISFPDDDRIAAWQIADAAIVPGLVHVSDAARGVHPLTMEAFMTRPNVDLDIDGVHVSPRGWLLAGGHPDAVARLAEGLTLR